MILYHFNYTLKKKTRVAALLLIALNSFFFHSNTLSAQKMLLLEKTTRVKPKKYFVGDALTYRLNDGYKSWHSAHIEAIYPEEQAVQIGIQKVPIADILAIRKARPGLSYLGKQALLFGAQTAFYTGIALLLEDDKSQAQRFAIFGGSLGLGTWLTSVAFRYKKKKMGTKYRLRVVEVPILPERK